MLELKNYSDWSSESEIADPAERIRRYSDYARTGYFKAGELNEETAAGLADMEAKVALREGLISEEMPEEEINGVMAGLRPTPVADTDADAKFLLDYYSLDKNPLDPEIAPKAASLRRYLTLRRMAPERVESDGILDAVNPLIGDAAAVRAARKASVDRGDSQLVALDGEGGREILVGPGTDRETVTGKLDSLFATGAISPADLNLVEPLLRPVNGGLSNGAQTSRLDFFRNALEDLSEQDPDLLEALNTDAAERARREEWAAKSGGEKALAAGIQVFGAPFSGLGDALKEGGRALGLVKLPEQGAPARDLVQKLSDNEAIRNAFSPEEIVQFSEALVARQAGPAYRPDKPGSGITADSLGNPIIARALVPNGAKFEAELAASKLSDEQKATARLMRAANHAQQAPENLKSILAENDDAVSALAVHRAAGGNDEDFVDSWLSNPENYSGNFERAQQLGSIAASSVPRIIFGIGALAGNETSLKIVQRMEKDQSDRQAYSRMFGDEYGLGFQVLAALPDVATQILTSIGTGGALAAVRGAVTGAARGGIKAASRNALKSVVGGVGAETSALVKSAAAAGGESATGLAFRELGKSISTGITTIERLVPVGATTFAQSAGATYSQLYSQMPASMSHEEKHRNVFGYAVASGIGTAAVTMGMGALGRGGIEDLATGRIRPWSLADDSLDDAFKKGAVAGERRVNFQDLNYKQAKLLYEATENSAKTVTDQTFQKVLRNRIGGAYKNYFRTALKSGWDEGLEESIDTSVQLAIEEAATGKRGTIAERAQQVWHSFVIGGAIGSGGSSVSQLATPLGRNDVGMALDSQMSLLSKVAGDLTKAGSPATAAVLMQRLDGYQKAATELRQKEAAEAEAAAAKLASGEPAEEPSTARFDNDLEEGTLLTDLNGSNVRLGDESGVVQIEGDQAYFIPQAVDRNSRKRTKKKKGGVETPGEPEVSTKSPRILLGNRLNKAAGVVTNLPTYKRKDDGTYFVDVGSREFRLPTLEESMRSPEGLLQIKRSDSGRVQQVIINGLRGVENPDMTADRYSETNPYRISLLGRLYNLDLSTRPVKADPVEEDAEEGVADPVAEAAPVETTPTPDPAVAGPTAAPTTPKGKKGKKGYVEAEQFNLFDVDLVDPVRTGPGISARPAGNLTGPVAPVVPEEGASLFSEDGKRTNTLDLNFAAADPAQPELDFREEWQVTRDRVLADLDKKIASRKERLARIPDEKARAPIEAELKRATQQRKFYQKYDASGTIGIAPLSPEQQEALMPLDLVWKNELDALLSSMIKPIGANKKEVKANTVGRAMYLLDRIQSFEDESRSHVLESLVRQLSESFDITSIRAYVGMAQDYLEDPPEGTPAPSADYARRKSAELDDLLNKIDLGEMFISESAEDELTGDYLDVIRALNGGIPAEPVELVEEEPIPAARPLNDRIEDFVAELEAAKKAIGETSFRYGKDMDPERSKRLRAKLDQLLSDTIKNVIQKQGKDLYQETQQLMELEEQGKQAMLDKIAASVLGYNKFITKGVHAQRKAPRTFLDPPNTKWTGGKPVASGRRYTDLNWFRTEKEAELFQELVVSGQGPGYRSGAGGGFRLPNQSFSLEGVGAMPSLVGQYATTVDQAGTPVVYPAFSPAKVDHLKKDGTYTIPSQYLKAKAEHLAERIRALYPETGTFALVGGTEKTNKRGEKTVIDGRWVYTVEGKGKRGAKKYTVEIARVSGADLVLMPRLERTVSISPDDEPATIGVFTNNPVVTRAQLASGWRIPVPEGFQNLNPSIAAKNGFVYATYQPGDFDRTSPVLAGNDIPLAEAHSGMGGTPRTGHYGAAVTTLFHNSYGTTTKSPDIGLVEYAEGARKSVRFMTPPAKGSVTISSRQREYYFNDEYARVSKQLSGILYASRRSKNTRSPWDDGHIEAVVQETFLTFDYILKEYTLAQQMTRSVLGTFRNQLKKDLSGPALAAYEAYVAGSDPAFLDLPVEDQRKLMTLLAPEAMFDELASTNASKFIIAAFPGVPLDVLGRGLRELHPKQVNSSDAPTAVMQYARFLFSGVVGEGGAFSYIPTANDGRVMAAFNASARKYAILELRARRNMRRGMSVDTVSMSESDPMYDGTSTGSLSSITSQFDIGEENRATLESLDSYRAQVRPSQFTASVQASQIEMENPDLWADYLSYDHQLRVVEELAQTVIGDTAVQRAFQDLAKLISTRLKRPDFSERKGRELVTLVANYLNTAAFYGDTNKFMLSLNKTPEGKRVASLLLVHGWLPPVTVAQRENTGRNYVGTAKDPMATKNLVRDINTPLMTPSEVAQYFGGRLVDPGDSENVQRYKVRAAATAIYKKQVADKAAADLGLEPSEYTVLETNEDLLQYQELYMEAASNVQSTVMDYLAEYNANASATERLLARLHELEEDAGFLISGTRGDLTTADKKETVRLMIEGKVLRADQAKARADKARAEASSLEELIKDESGRWGYKGWIEGLIKLRDSKVLPAKSTFLTASSASSVRDQVGPSVADIYEAAPDEKTKRAAIQQQIEWLMVERKKILTDAPVRAEFLRTLADTQQKIADDNYGYAEKMAGSNMVKVVEDLSQRHAETAIVLNELRDRASTLKPAAKAILTTEIDRLREFYDAAGWPGKTDYVIPETKEYAKKLVAASEAKAKAAIGGPVLTDAARALIARVEQSKANEEATLAAARAGRTTFNKSTMFQPSPGNPGGAPVWRPRELPGNDPHAGASEDIHGSEASPDAFPVSDLLAQQQAWNGLMYPEGRERRTYSMREGESVDEIGDEAREAWDKHVLETQLAKQIADAQLPGDREDTPNTRDAPRQPSKVNPLKSWQREFQSLSTLSPEFREAARAMNTEEMNTLGLKDGDSNSMIGALQIIAKSANKAHRKVAAALLAGNGSFIRMIRFSVKDAADGNAGTYSRENGITINLSEHNGRGVADVLLHELVHAATLDMIIDPKTPAQAEAVRRLGQLREMAKAMARNNGVTDPTVLGSLESDGEFVTHALTVPEFQHLLRSLRPPGQRSVWERILDWVGQLFGANRAFDELLDFTRMGSVSRRTFNTDLRWDIRDGAERVADAEEMSFHAGRLWASRSTLPEGPAPDPSNRINIADLKDSRGQIGKQGFTAEGVVNLIGLATGQNYDPADLRAALDAVRADPTQLAQVVDFLEQTPIKTTLEPDGTYHLDDGHHRAFLADQVGLTSLPTNNDNDIRFALASGELAPGGLSINPIRELEAMIPPGMNLVQDDQMSGVMGTRRGEPNVIRFNGRLLPGAMLRGLSAKNARAVLRATLDEELAELAADAVMTDGDYTELAATLAPAERAKLEHSYFGVAYTDFTERSAKIAGMRESGEWTDADLGREWFRQRSTKMAFGATREQVITELLDYQDTNPGLFTKIIEWFSAKLAGLRSLLSDNYTNTIAAKVSQTARALRRLRNDGVLPDPAAAPDGEYGDTTAFLNSLDDVILPGQEDRTRFALPVAGPPAVVDSFWNKVERKIAAKSYDVKFREIKDILDKKDGTLSEVQYTMEHFGRRFPKLRDEAIEAGVPVPDIMLVLGSTAPMVSEAEKKQVVADLKAFRAKFRNGKLTRELDPEEFAEMMRQSDIEERRLYDAAASKMAAGFRIGQKKMEDTLRAKGFSPLVDLLVEFRNQINRYKVQAGFSESNDVYLTRSYRYFKTPAYAHAVKHGGTYTDEDGKSVDFDALRQIAATNMFKEEVIKEAKEGGKHSLPASEVDRLVMEKLDGYLQTLDARAATTRTFDGITMLRRDLNLLKTKKDIDEPLRELLGEVTDPFETGVRTIYNVARFAANEAFLKDFESTAMNLGIASRTPQEGMSLLFPDKQADKLAGLAGLYVRTDVHNAIKREFEIRAQSMETDSEGIVFGAGRLAAKFSGLTIAAKTSGGIGYWARNMVGGLVLTLTQGLNPFNVNTLKKSFQLSRLGNISLGENSTEVERDVVRRLVELQILRDDTQGRIAIDLMKGFVAGTQEQLDDTLAMLVAAEESKDPTMRAKAQEFVTSRFGKLLAGANQLNNAVDSLFKINAYFQEMANLKGSFGDTKTEDELEAMAARKVKLTFPTHSQQLSGVKVFNKSPYSMLFLPFLRWKTEVIRTMVNTPLLAMEEMRSDNPGEKARGARRMIGFAAVASPFATATVAGVYNVIFGMLLEDDEEEKKLEEEAIADIRRGLPQWQKDRNLVAHTVGGKLRVMDLSSILPYSMVGDIFRLSTEGIANGRGVDLKALAGYITGDVAGTNIAFSTLDEVRVNRDDYGNPIYLKTDSAHIAFGKMLLHIGAGTLAPSAGRKLVQAFRPGESQTTEILVGELTGGRPIYHERSEVLRRGLFGLKEEQNEAVALLRDLASGRKLDVGEIEGLLQDHQSALNKNQLNLHRFLGTMRSLGMSERDVMLAAKQARYSSDSVESASAGYRLAWRPNDQWYEKVNYNVTKLGEDDFAARRAKMEEVLSTKPDYYPVVPSE